MLGDWLSVGVADGQALGAELLLGEILGKLVGLVLGA